MKYRKLINGTVRQDDLYWTGFGAAPDAIEGDDSRLAPYARGNSGNIGMNIHDNWIWYRPIKEDNWISFAERKPTKEDEFSGYSGATTKVYGVLVRWESDGSMGFWTVEDLRYDTDFHWMSLNFIPREPARIKVDGKEIIPQSDGSVKLSCGTVIPKKDVKEFIRQYNEVAK